jgi:phosphoglycolate phosphatase
MTVKGIIFDLDGTLLDTITDITNSMNLVLQEMSLPSLSENQYKTFIGSGVQQLVERVIPQHKNNQEIIDNFLASFRKYYEQKWKEHSSPFEGIIELIEYLFEKKIKIAILSNKPHKNTIEMTKELLPDRFEFIYGERLPEGIPKKPDPYAALEIGKLFGEKPENILFVGDTDVDMLTAQNANMIGVGVLWGFREKKELLNSGAKYIVQKPLDICEILKEEYSFE